MPIFNCKSRELICKIVYFGPSLGGKTTSIKAIHELMPEANRSALQTIDTVADRTLFFDFFSLETAKVGGMQARFQIYGVPGQSFYRATRKMVLMGADGVVFVADSAAERLSDNLASYEDLKDLLREQGHNYEEMPLVMQYNKRDLPEATSVETLEACLNQRNAPYFESVATENKGVREPFRAICREILAKLTRDAGSVGSSAQPAATIRDPGSTGATME
jgi:hypothetical protein